MDIWDYFPPKSMLLLFHDIKIIDSPRAKARLFFSESFNQIIYIKKIDFTRSISKLDFIRKRDGVKEKMMSDALRRMQQLCGQKKGYRKYSKAYKLLILLAPNISKSVYSYLWALNRLLKNKYQKLMFGVFDYSVISQENIAGAIYGILYKQYQGWYNIIKKSLEERNVKPFGNLQIKFQDLEFICNKLSQNFYKYSSRVILKKIIEKELGYMELNIVVHNLGNPSSTFTQTGGIKCL